MKRFIALLVTLFAAGFALAAQPDYVEVGRYGEEALWQNARLDQTLLWDILSGDTHKRMLAVEVKSRRSKDGEYTFPLTAEEVVKYIRNAYNQWRAQTNLFLPERFRLPALGVVNAQEGPFENQITYSVVLETDTQSNVVGRAGYYKDGTRSAMLLPVLARIDIYAEKAAEVPAGSSQQELLRRRLLLPYEELAAQIISGKHGINREQALDLLHMQQITEWHLYHSLSPLSAVIKAVITHEFGHHLGLSHGEQGTIMAQEMNSPQTPVNVTEADGKRAAVLACYVWNNLPDADPQHPCTPYPRARR